MGAPLKLFRLLPSSTRKLIIGAVDRAVPARFCLPYIHLKLQLQQALEEEMRWLPRLVERDGVAIDVGANVGLYSYRLSKLCRRVEAFEPNSACLAILQAYDAPNVQTHRIALSSEPGTLFLNIPVVDGIAQHGLGSALLPSGINSICIQAQKSRLDDFNFADVCFIKIDVEGHELEVLAGAERTILQNYPAVLIEIEERHQQSGLPAVFKVFAEFGYSGFFVFEGSLQPLESFSAAYHQRGYLDARQRVKYVNNFIFLRPEQEARLRARS